jgi:hypothetical protein
MADTNTQLRISAYSAVLFFLVANPETYKLVRSVLGNWVSGPGGCPSRQGLILHSIVFLALVFLSMRLGKKESMKAGCGCA